MLEDIHGNSKPAKLGGWLWGKRITISPNSYDEGRKNFTELHDFFTQSFGPGIDIQTLETLNPRPLCNWIYQIESKYGNHRFFVKERKDLDWFLLKYNDKLNNWSR
jgi:hypothetical protein